MEQIKVGDIRRMLNSYDGKSEVIITAVGINKVLLAPLPLIIFNVEVIESSSGMKSLMENSVPVVRERVGEEGV